MSRPQDPAGDPAPGDPRAPRGTWDLVVDADKHPGWINGKLRPPLPGERIYTTEGDAVVLRVVGRRGPDDYLLEVTMGDGRKAPFFATAGNVLVRSDPDAPLDESIPGPPFTHGLPPVHFDPLSIRRRED